MSQITQHGENIANEIQGEDSFGDSDNLTDADVWNIIDQLHTHMMDTRSGDDPIFSILEDAMQELEIIDEDLPV